MTRRLLTTLTLLGGFLALWSAPAPAAPTMAFVTYPVHVHGYTLRLVAVRDFSPRVSVSVVLLRQVGKPRRPVYLGGLGSFQRHEWIATRGRLTASRDLRRGSLRAKFGPKGRIRMTFSAEDGAARGNVPWCTGPPRRNRRNPGTLSGVLDLQSGPGRFGRLVLRSVPAWLERGPQYGFTCHAPAIESFQGNGAPTLHLRTSPPRREIEIWGSPTGPFSMYAQDHTRPYEIHEIVAHTTEPGFSYNDDLSSASATGIAPFFTGTLSFTRTNESGMGTVAGRLTAALAAPGAFTIDSSASAFLFSESP